MAQLNCYNQSDSEVTFSNGSAKCTAAANGKCTLEGNSPFPWEVSVSAAPGEALPVPGPSPDVCVFWNPKDFGLGQGECP